MKKIIITILSVYLIVTSIFGMSSKEFNNLSKTQIQSEFSSIETGMSVTDVKSHLGKEEVVFQDTDYDEYAWIDYDKKIDIRIRFKDNKAIYKHINMNFAKDSFE